MSGEAKVISLGAVLTLTGVAATPAIHSFGNASFWLGVLLLVVGLGVFIIHR